MNVKKMFASLAGVLMLAQAAAPMVTGAATYSDELQGAYDYAYSKGITTMTSIDNANMYGELTRGQLSKMISQWAEKEMGVKADETASCSFSDASTAEGDLATWVVKACQMGLMGQGITAFRPNDKVTRGEFGTVLSRAIWGDKYNQENPFYAKHLQALKDAGIMTKIEEPNSLEIRGWVMLMLQRAAETVSGDDECNDPAVLLACALGSTGCPAKCAEKEGEKSTINPYEGVQAGDLSVAVSTAASTVSIPNDGVIKVAELTIKASENIQLQSVDVTRLGLSENSGVKIWIEKDGRRITSSSSFFGDSKANITFNNGGYVVNGNETLDLVVSLSNVAAGSELQFKLSNLVSSAKSSSISPDTTGTFRTTKYSVTSVSASEVTNSGSVRNYNVSKDTTFSFGEFKLQNNSKASMEKDVLVRNITFKAEGSIENLNNFKLLRDGKEVSSKYTVDGKSITFTVNDQLDSGKSATYKVTAEPTNIEKEGGDTYKLRIDKSQDIVAEEVGQNATAYRVAIKGDTKDAEGNWNDFSTIYLGTTNIAGGNITLTRDDKFSSVVTADWGYSDATIAKGSIKVNQAIKFEKGATLTRKTADIISTAAPHTGDLSTVIRRASLIINGKTYQATTIAADKIIFDQEIYIDKGTHDVEVQVSLQNVKPSGAVDNASFELNAISNTTFDGGKYVNGDETPFQQAQMAGTIRVAKVNVQAQKMAYKKNGPSSDAEFVAGNTDERVILEGEITNNSDKVLEVNKFVLSGTTMTMHKLSGDQIVADAASTKKLGDFSVRFIDDGSTSSTVVYNANDTKVSLDSMTRSLEPNQSVRFEIRMIPNADLLDGDTFRFAVSAEGKLEGNTTTSSAINSATIKVKGTATASIVAATSGKNLIVLPGTSTQIASFNYNIKNDSIDLSSVVFDGAGLSEAMLDDVTLDFDGNRPSLHYSVDANGKLVLEFDNTLSLPVKNYNVKLYATFNNYAVEQYNNAGVAQPVVLSGVELVSTNSAATKSGSNLGYSHYVAKAYPILSVKDKNTNSGSERLDISIKKNTNDYTVRLNKIGSAATDWKVVEGSEEEITGNTGNVALDANSAVVVRSNTQHASITGVQFSVTDNEDNTVKYAVDVIKSSTMADFASLTL